LHSNEKTITFYFSFLFAFYAYGANGQLFFSVNKLNPKFKLILGKYVKKKVPTGKGTFIRTYEEKETDV